MQVTCSTAVLQVSCASDIMSAVLTVSAVHTKIVYNVNVAANKVKL